MVYALVCSVLCPALSAEADQIGELFNYYVGQLKSGTVTLTISEQPDESGFINEAHLEAKGAAYHQNERPVFQDTRIDSLFLNVSGIQLNPPSEWTDNSSVKFRRWQSSAFTVNVLDSDITTALKDKTFEFYSDGKNFIFHDVSVSITSGGVKITGFIKESEPYDWRSYAAAWLLGSAADDYPVEINSGLKIVNDKELWLDNPTVKRGTFSEIDGYIEREITNRNKPLVNLDEVDLDLSKIPITLHSIELNNGSLSISTATLPQALNGGIRYTNDASSLPAELPQGTIQPVELDDELRAKIADTISLSADKILTLSQESISAPKEPTQAIRDEMKSQNNELLGKFNTLTVNEGGYYVLKVTLSNDLYEKVKDANINDLKVYALFDDGQTQNASVSASVINGLLSTWELLTLNGDKLEAGAKEFLMVGLLETGKPFSLYLTKILLAILTSGCNAGLGVFGAIALVALGSAFIRKH